MYPCHVLNHLLYGRSPQQAPNRRQWFDFLLSPSHLWKCFSYHDWIRQRARLRVGQGQRRPDEQDVFANITTYYKR